MKRWLLVLLFLLFAFPARATSNENLSEFGRFDQVILYRPPQPRRVLFVSDDSGRAFIDSEVDAAPAARDLPIVGLGALE